MSLHRPKAAAHLRTGEEFTRLKRARDEFWTRAQREGVDPIGHDQKLRAQAPTYLDPPPPDIYRIYGAGPGRWPKHVREWPEWRAWLRLRDKVVVGHLALCHSLTMDRLTKEEKGDPLSYDFEEALQTARIIFCDRVIELFDPDKVNPATGNPYAFSTYANRWTWNAVADWRRKRTQEEIKRMDLDPEIIDSEHEGWLTTLANVD